MNYHNFSDSYKKEVQLLFLTESFFKNPTDFSPALLNGIMNIIDSSSDYHEEGKPLFPEIIFVTDIFHFEKKLPSIKRIRLGEFPLPVENESLFDKILKKCAPFTNNGWVIYVEINQFSSPLKVEFGILNGEDNELSAPLFDLVREKAVDIVQEMSCIFLRNIGQKTVHLDGLKDGSITLAFSAKKIEVHPYDQIEIVASEITKKMLGQKKKTIQYLRKRIFSAINQGHGTLIGVIKGEIQENNSSFIGTKIDPIDFGAIISGLVKGEETLRHELNIKSSILDTALNIDGITIFSNDGKMLGFQYIIHNTDTSYNSTIGGARSQAFEAMKNSGLFTCCFYKSQDGKTKLWQRQKRK
ncbi:MAG: hypothetical protein ACJ77K_16185 [Bacteroidia bacterium]